jgi:hypothetical protein
MWGRASPHCLNHILRKASSGVSVMQTLAHTASSSMLPPPSRATNPFATCWTKPGALAYHFNSGQDAEQLIKQLAASEWRGAILGLHGSGKSTLIETLKPVLLAAGLEIRTICLRDAQRSLPTKLLTDSFPRGATGSAGGCVPVAHTISWCAPRILLIIDGYEQLGRVQRWRLHRRCRRASIGLLVTSHLPTGLPTLITLAPDLSLVQKLVDSLRKHAPTPITPNDVAASHASCGSNVRELFFDLYDRHEQLRIGERTGPLSAS